MAIIALYIILGIVLLIGLFLSLRIKLQIIYKEELKLYFRFLFFKTDLLSKDATNKIDIKKLIATIEEKPEAEISEADTSESSSPSIIDKLNSVRQILSLLFNAFRKHLHVKLTQIQIKVATSDAAQTAILYGAVSTAVACIIELIDSQTNLDKLKKSSVTVEPDFISEKSDIKLNILLSISLLGIIKVMMKSFFKYFSINEKTQINNRKEN